VLNASGVLLGVLKQVDNLEVRFLAILLPSLAVFRRNNSLQSFYVVG
jgi:hypothetical protein